MKKLLLTTALVTLIAAMPVTAQTTDPATGDAATTGTFTPPEGYTQFEVSTLTVEDLRGATIYDANGESVGEISDFVLAGGTTTPTPDTTTGADASGGMTDTDTTTGTTTDTTTGTTADTGSDAGTADTADTTSGTTTDTTGDTGTTTTDTMTDTTTDGTGTVTSTDTEQSVDVSDGQISHVVLDIGGFLGMGAHTVAVPIEELQVFRDGNNDVRVYLPWTQAQLEALPEYDANNPGTLDATKGTTN